MTRWIAASALALLASLLLVASGAAQKITKSDLKGPFTLRKQFPLDLLFLGFTPGKVSTPRAGDFKWSLQSARSNVFVKSSGVLEVIRDEERGVIDDATLRELLRQRNLDNQYLFDLEMLSFTALVEYGVSEHLSLFAEVPLLEYDGGILDGLIEGFHRIFDFPSDDRPLLRRDQEQIILLLDGELYYKRPGEIDGTRLGDVILGSQWLFNRGQGSWPAAALRFALKVPTANHRALRGSGSFDFGISLRLHKLFKRNAIYLSSDVVLPGRWRLFPGFDPEPFFGLAFGLEHAFSKKLSLVVQNASYSNVLTGKAMLGIADISHEVTAGIKYDLFENLRISFALRENYERFQSSSDIGIHLGIENIIR